MKAWIVLLLLLPSAARAEKYAPVYQDNPEPYHRAVFRVDVGGGIGSGTLIAVDGKGLGAVLTAAHVVDAGSTYRVGFPDSVSIGSSAFLIGRDKQLDLAVLLVGVPVDLPYYIPLASKLPEKGDPLELCGYGGWRWGVTKTTVRGYFNHAWANYKTDIGLNQIAIPGESGGPILCFEDGAPRVAGVIWGGKVTLRGGPMDFGQGANCEQIRAWLRQAVSKKYPWIESK